MHELGYHYKGYFMITVAEEAHMIKGYIFDLDGVLVDTAKYHFLAWKQLAQTLNIDFTLEDNERLKGVSRMRSLDIILEIGQVTLEEGQKITLADQKNEWYKEYIMKMDETEILTGVSAFLTHIKAKGMKIALGSASKNSPIILERTGLSQFFDAIVDGNDVTTAKPDPEVFLLGAQRLGLPPEHCVVFEDAQAGIEAAKAAGMKVIAVGSEENLKGGDLYIENMEKDFERLEAYLMEV